MDAAGAMGDHSLPGPGLAHRAHSVRAFRAEGAHLGNHAWPTMNNAILTFVPDDKVDDILAMVRAKDEETPALGLRAFVWNIEKSY